MQELLGDLLTLSSSDRPAENAVSAVGLMEGLAASQSTPC
jgi:hypothetical protein